MNDSHSYSLSLAYIDERRGKGNLEGGSTESCPYTYSWANKTPNPIYPIRARWAAFLCVHFSSGMTNWVCMQKRKDIWGAMQGLRRVTRPRKPPWQITFPIILEAHIADNEWAGSFWIQSQSEPTFLINSSATPIFRRNLSWAWPRLSPRTASSWNRAGIQEVFLTFWLSLSPPHTYINRPERPETEGIRFLDFHMTW